MKHAFLAAVAALALAACTPPAATTASTTDAAAVAADAPNIVAAVADPRRTDAEKARDASRHPAETLAFAGVKPGDKVGELMPGGGYFTRLFAVAVGDTGNVYPVIRPDGQAGNWEIPGIAVAAQYPNTIVQRQDFNTVTYPEPLDIVFTAQNYHDVPIADYNMGDNARINAAAFAALKPGGVYIVIDHSAVAGTPTATREQGALHRIDQATVRREVEAAGFVFDGESDVLRNPADTRTVNVFDDAIRGRTDQFMMRFRKPAV